MGWIFLEYQYSMQLHRLQIIITRIHHGILMYSGNWSLVYAAFCGHGE